MRGLMGIMFAVGLLAGCGPTSGAGTAANQVQNSQSTSNPQAGTDARQGVSTMLALTATMDAAIQAGDAGKAASTGGQLEDTWHGFEDQVHDKFPSDYQSVEQVLDPLVAGSKATPLDKKTLSGLNEHLQQTLQSLQKKLG